MPKKLLLILIICTLGFKLKAQDNYEIQVYGSETVEQGHTMVELHSNYTIDGSKTVSVDGQLPTDHAEHETVEITHGWTPWFETGFYFFNSIGTEGRTAYVGSHIRPRFAAPPPCYKSTALVDAIRRAARAPGIRLRASPGGQSL